MFNKKSFVLLLKTLMKPLNVYVDITSCFCTSIQKLWNSRRAYVWRDSTEKKSSGNTRLGGLCHHSISYNSTNLAVEYISITFQEQENPWCLFINFIKSFRQTSYSSLDVSSLLCHGISELHLLSCARKLQEKFYKKKNIAPGYVVGIIAWCCLKVYNSTLAEDKTLSAVNLLALKGNIEVSQHFVMSTWPQKARLRVNFLAYP